MTCYGLTPSQYREKWKLPSDYPMGSPQLRQPSLGLAKKIGLERKPTTSDAAVTLVPARRARGLKGYLRADRA